MELEKRPKYDFQQLLLLFLSISNTISFESTTLIFQFE